MIDSRRRLIEAIYDSTLESELPAEAATAIENIRRACREAREEFVQTLAASDIDCALDDRELEFPQFHRFTISLSSSDVELAVELGESLGYRQPDKLSPAQFAIFRRTRSELTLTRVDDATMRLRLVWVTPDRGSIARRFWPNIDDARWLPALRQLWPLAFLIRPVALVLRRLGIVQPSENIGEFLGTPKDLVPSLLEFADVSSEDLIVDLGCGDGRILIEAAAQYGSRSIGYEIDEDLCRRARDKAAERGVSPKVVIHCSDVSLADLSNATLVFLFMPPSSVADLVPKILAKLPLGGRVIAHEQSRIDFEVEPIESRVLFGESSLTVAHRWIVA